MYEKNADIMSSLAGAKDSVGKGALSLLAKLRGSSANDVMADRETQGRQMLDSMTEAIPESIQEKLKDLSSQPVGELADKATKALSNMETSSKLDTNPSALSYIPGIGGYLSGLAKPIPGRGRFVSSVGEGVAGGAGAGVGGALGLTGGATLGGVGHLLLSLLSKGKYNKLTAGLGAQPAMMGGAALGGLAGSSLGTNAGAGFLRDIAAKPEKSAELIGDQEELDVNDNDKIDAADLAMLRKNKKPLKDKAAEFTPYMPLPNKKPNPFISGKKTPTKADAAGAQAALAKLGSSHDCSPSDAGNNKGVKYKQQIADHATGEAAFDSLDKYMRMSKKAGLNNFQTTFFGRLIQEGKNEHEIYEAVKQSGDQFGAEVGKELNKGLEKLALMSVLGGLGRAAMAGGRAVASGAKGAYTGAKAGISASNAGKAIGQAGSALGEAGQAARLAGSQARSAIGTGYQTAKGAIGSGLSNASGAIGSGLSNASGAIGTGYQAAKGAIGGALPGMQQGLGNAVTATGNFLGNNAKTIGALGAGGGIAYGASQIPGAVERGVNTAVNQGIDRGMDRFKNTMQQMPNQMGGMISQGMGQAQQLGGDLMSRFGMGKTSSEKRAIAAAVQGAKSFLPAIGKYFGISGGMPFAGAKGLFNAAKSTGSSAGEAALKVLNNPAMKGQMITGASTGALNPFTGLLATGDQDESYANYFGRSALSALGGAGLGLAGGKGTQDLMRRMGAGSQIGATGDLAATISGYDTGGMGAKGGFIGGGLMPAAVPKFLGNKINNLAGGKPEVLSRMGQTILPREAGSTAQLLEKLDPLGYAGSLLGKGIGKSYNAIKNNAPGALAATKDYIKNNPAVSGGLALGGVGLAGGAYLGNRAVSAMEGARGDLNQQMNMFRQTTNNQMNGLRNDLDGGIGGIGKFFNENKSWLMPMLLAGGGALAGNAVGGGTGAALGGLSLPAIYMMYQNGMLGGGGGNPMLANSQKRPDYMQQTNQVSQDEINKQIASRNADPRLKIL